MNVKKLLLVCYLLVAGWLAQAQNFGPYASAVWINRSDGGHSGWYNTSYKTPNGFLTDADHAIQNNPIINIQGQPLGTYNSKSGNLSVRGVEVKTYKSTGNNCRPELRFVSYPTATPPATKDWNTKQADFFQECNLGESRFPDNPGHGPCNTNGYQK